GQGAGAAQQGAGAAQQGAEGPYRLPARHHDLAPPPPQTTDRRGLGNRSPAFLLGVTVTHSPEERTALKQIYQLMRQWSVERDMLPHTEADNGGAECQQRYSTDGSRQKSKAKA